MMSGLPLILAYYFLFQDRLSSKADYSKFIDPLLKVEDFGMHYYDEGAAAASVLYPNSKANPRPPDAVVALLRLGSSAVPLLIDCLTDERVTSVRFDGNHIVRPFSVPAGYVCLDILMGVIRANSIFEAECAYDGLGACVNVGYYFRPDDYSNCWEELRKCQARPWVGVVQSNWVKAFLGHRLRFRNPYDELGDEYKDFTSRALRARDR